MINTFKRTIHIRKDLRNSSEAMKQIDSFRQSVANKNINLKKLLEVSKADQRNY